MTPSKAHDQRAAIGAAVIAVVIIVLAFAAAGVGGFVIQVPITAESAVQIQSVSMSTVVYTTSSQTVIQVTQNQPTSQSVFYTGAFALDKDPANQANNMVTSANIPGGADVSVSWSASDTVDVYVFDSTQYSVWQSNHGTTSPNMASQPGAQNGTVGFHTSFTDTYYLVVHNPHTCGLFCFGGNNVTLYGTNGTATYSVQTTVFVTQTMTYTTSRVTPVTVTSTSTTTKTCSTPFWYSFGQHVCP